MLEHAPQIVQATHHLPLTRFLLIVKRIQSSGWIGELLQFAVRSLLERCLRPQRLESRLGSGLLAFVELVDDRQFACEIAVVFVRQDLMCVVVGVVFDLNDWVFGFALLLLVFQSLLVCLHLFLHLVVDGSLNCVMAGRQDSCWRFSVCWWLRLLLVRCLSLLSADKLRPQYRRKIRPILELVLTLDVEISLRLGEEVGVVCALIRRHQRGKQM